MPNDDKISSNERQLIALEKIAKHLGDIHSEIFQLRKRKTGPAVTKK
jgi:hypothetical protein